MKSLCRPESHLIASFLFLLLAFCISCEKPVTVFDEEENAEYLEKVQKSSVPSPDSTIRVMTWNIRFGIGRGPWFGDACGYKVIYSKEEIYPNLQLIAAKINELKPDILLLQEVDLNSTRSAYINELSWLLEHTWFNYCVHGSVWRAQLIPSDGLGRMDESNAIFSRWPLKDAKRIQLALRQDQSGIVRYFYERANMVEARVEIPGFREFYAVNVHASAFATDDTKHQHIVEFKSELDRIAATGALFVAGGDLNTLPPGSTQTDFCMEDRCEEESFHNTGDHPMHKDGSDYTPEKEWMVPLYTTYSCAVPLSRYLADQEAWFTHTTRPDHFWDRTLDYLFTNGKWKSGETWIGQDLRQESDHAPVAGKLYLVKDN